MKKTHNLNYKVHFKKLGTSFFNTQRSNTLFFKVNVSQADDFFSEKHWKKLNVCPKHFESDFRAMNADWNSMQSSISLIRFLRMIFMELINYGLKMTVLFAVGDCGSLSKFLSPTFAAAPKHSNSSIVICLRISSVLLL